MTTVQDALVRYPPSVSSRCSSRSTKGPGCPRCPNVQPPATGTSAVRFQLTYTCDSATYSSCYYPRPVYCQPPVKPPVKTINCCLNWFDCYGKPIKRTSTLPPLCCHGPKPLPYVWPKYGCPPIQECPPPICYPPRSCPTLICRPRPEPPPRPPTLCIAGPCPALAEPLPPNCPSSHCQKIKPPASCVRYCIRSTCGESTYVPCYSSNLPKCPRTDCC